MRFGKFQNTRKARKHEDYKSVMAATEALPRKRFIVCRRPTWQLPQLTHGTKAAQIDTLNNELGY